MRKTHFLFSAVQFVFILFLFLLGGVCIGIDSLESVRHSLALALFNDRISWQGIGCSILLVAILMALGFYRIYRGVYLQIRMQRGVVFIDLSIVKEVVKKYFQKTSSDQEIEVILRTGNQIEIVVSADEEIESSLEKTSIIEGELGAILTSHFGPEHRWVVTFAFNES
ncbi:MAG: hypothetical protein HYZ48_02055 [Chlamydiales bacterium]|nr:hypothetical protein [Chlamydiales bacterium]